MSPLEYIPAAQEEQKLEPEFEENVPSAQDEQAADASPPVIGPYMPAAQLRQAVLPLVAA